MSSCAARSACADPPGGADDLAPRPLVLAAPAGSKVQQGRVTQHAPANTCMLTQSSTLSRAMRGLPLLKTCRPALVLAAPAGCVQHEHVTMQEAWCGGRTTSSAFVAGPACIEPCACMCWRCLQSTESKLYQRQAMLLA